MFSVIFEVLPAEGKKDEYLGLAKHLKPIIETIDGFVDNERFESQRRPGWVLSHSTWRDEKSVVRWRTEGEHHAVQGKGRFEIFQDYHLRVGDVTADTDPPREAPIHERRLDETEVGAAKIVTFTEITPDKGAGFAAQIDLLPAHLGLDLKNGAVIDHDVFASIYNPGKLALLVGWIGPEAANAWSPKKVDGIEQLRHRQIRVVRDYGRFDRREAPQFYPDIKGAETRHPEPAHRKGA
ncbi:MAG: antibiotic biosynthesis monooxygenase [Bradyrhizobium sp.]|jgi:heme-degrading monooxygenase HmoA|uniref:antibiotic biosynthesis monooxygenase family protein n=1 Tax=Bradyrhizobium sp. TaxID=376 RepID=UPI0012155E6F|nr:antibiotic biosynthesis monooxygenase [Bradyrhizobium sp.]THD53276.1 MAG: antibiotic biosynthesis monooxygenase [Bradyrhizobium sp.]